MTLPQFQSWFQAGLTRPLTRRDLMCRSQPCQRDPHRAKTGNTCPSGQCRINQHPSPISDRKAARTEIAKHPLASTGPLCHSTAIATSLTRQLTSDQWQTIWRHWRLILKIPKCPSLCPPHAPASQGRAMTFRVSHSDKRAQSSTSNIEKNWPARADMEDNTTNILFK